MKEENGRGSERVEAMLRLFALEREDLSENEIFTTYRKIHII